MRIGLCLEAVVQRVVGAALGVRGGPTLGEGGVSDAVGLDLDLVVAAHHLDRHLRQLCSQSGSKGARQRDMLLTLSRVWLADDR